MEPEYRIITREIVAKGKGYLVIRRCGAGEVLELVRRGARALLEAGAAVIYVASLDPAAPLAEGEGDGFRLVHRHDIARMERALDPGRPRPSGRLTLEPLSREKGGQWLALHNECFFDMDNSATYDRTDLDRAMEADHRGGFALLEGVPVGVYELNCETGCPEIEGIALVKDVRGRGLGRELLLACMEELAGAGYGACCLLVSTTNEAAWNLYRRTGFTQTGIRSRWYQVVALGDLRGE